MTIKEINNLNLKNLIHLGYEYSGHYNNGVEHVFIDKLYTIRIVIEVQKTIIFTNRIKSINVYNINSDLPLISFFNDFQIYSQSETSYNNFKVIKKFTKKLYNILEYLKKDESYYPNITILYKKEVIKHKRLMIINNLLNEKSDIKTNSLFNYIKNILYRICIIKTK